jgi:hypothetical protein
VNKTLNAALRILTILGLTALQMVQLPLLAVSEITAILAGNLLEPIVKDVEGLKRKLEQAA